jgi:hypothetical protein
MYSMRHVGIGSLIDRRHGVDAGKEDRPEKQEEESTIPTEVQSLMIGREERFFQRGERGEIATIGV